jgi:hypothetical protein
MQIQHKVGQLFGSRRISQTQQQQSTTINRNITKALVAPWRDYLERQAPASSAGSSHLNVLEHTPATHTHTHMAILIHLYDIYTYVLPTIKELTQV